MASKFIFFSFKLYFIILFILNIPLIISSISFIYPNAVTLKNGNIFVIHRYGISICDSSYSTIIKNITNFPTNQLISNEDYLSKVAIAQFEDGYIVSVIIDKIYIFNSFGENVYSRQSLISGQDLYFTISPSKIVSNKYYYYLIGYIYQESLYLKYYYYDSQLQNNQQDAYADGLKDIYYSSNNPDYSRIKNKGLSCQTMTYYSESLFVCMFYVSFYSYDNSVAIALFKANNGLINYKYDNKYYVIYYSFDDIYCIKSSISDDRSKAFFGLYDRTGVAYIIIYYIYPDNINAYILEEECRINYYSLKTYYFPEKEEFAVSCLTKKGNIQIVFINKLFEDTSIYEIFKFNDCSNIYGYSLIYSINYNKYYIISDAKCQGIYTFEQLIDDIIEE